MYEINPRELVELRLQLVEELEQVEALEQQLAEQMTPQTVQEVEMLETELQDALGELKALKGGMRLARTNLTGRLSPHVSEPRSEAVDIQTRSKSMHSLPVANEIAQRTFRANPDLRLELYDRLPLEQQELLHGLQDDPDFYGVLSPPKSPNWVSSPPAARRPCSF